MSFDGTAKEAKGSLDELSKAKGRIGEPRYEVTRA